MKNSAMKRAESGNSRSMSCLPTSYKLLTGVVAETVQWHLVENDLFPSEQKGNHSKSAETKDQFLNDKMIFGKLQENVDQLECSLD